MVGTQDGGRKGRFFFPEFAFFGFVFIKIIGTQFHAHCHKRYGSSADLRPFNLSNDGGFLRPLQLPHHRAAKLQIVGLRKCLVAHTNDYNSVQLQPARRKDRDAFAQLAFKLGRFDGTTDGIRAGFIQVTGNWAKPKRFANKQRNHAMGGCSKGMEFDHGQLSHGQSQLSYIGGHCA